MVKKNIGLVVKLFLVIALCTLIASADQTNDSDKYTFTNYGGEVYTPEAMEFGANLDGTEQISVMTTSATLENQTERKHVLLQFYETPNDEQLGALKEYEVRRVAVAAKYTSIFSMPADYTAADLPGDVGLRWMGEIPVENKYDKSYGLNVPYYAKMEDGNVKLAVVFYEDVTSQDSINIIQKYTDNFSTPMIDILEYEIITAESNISLIANEDAVKHVGYYGYETVPTYDSDFADYEEIIEEDIENDSTLTNEQEINVSDTKNGVDSEIKKSPSFSSVMTLVFLTLSVVVCYRK
ncbi:hypothetical protein [Methanolobus profundi]|uniref:Uncharacterized protein n=1 Tax=Methanolobus profundi TaxID=487685 RepID=A0A1I4S4F4_9EURY|nr:hypothetical protein [Methanolobus profundi]SFM59367.1 hypothetical protein SAMN04488696_1768 [Methanolobus profundi]